MEQWPANFKNNVEKKSLTTDVRREHFKMKVNLIARPNSSLNRFDFSLKSQPDVLQKAQSTKPRWQRQFTRSAADNKI
jgi:hypothetical protein